MKRLLFVAVILFFCAFDAGTAHAAVQPFNAEYSVRYRGIPARAQASLSASGSNWSYVMTISNPVASMSQATVFQERDGVFVLLGGSDQVRYPGNQRSATTRYNWRDREVRWTGDVKPGRAGPVALQARDVDALLLQLALVRDGRGGRELNYRVLENGRARPMTFRSSGTEQIEIGRRSVTATRYSQVGDGKTTTIWVAPGVPVPVRLTQQEGGRETVRMSLSSWR